jgi:hypothetical protein
VVSHVLIERDTGKEIGRLGQLPSTLDPPTRRLLDADHEGTLVSKDFDRFFRVEAIPRAEIDAAIKKAREEKKP